MQNLRSIEMSSIKSAIKRARKIIKEIEAEASDTRNTYLITNDFEGEPLGSLVVILASIDNHEDIHEAHTTIQ